MSRTISSYAPDWLKPPARKLRAARVRIRNQLVRFANRGANRSCPVCRTDSRWFARFGDPLREDARCVHCGACERHRLVWLFFEQSTDLFDGRAKRVLHFAPEVCLEARLRSRIGDGYVTADLRDKRAMVAMDITDIPAPDESFDVIYCSHVLEHVPNDRKALQEIARTLKRGGWAVLLVPVIEAKTLEDPSIVDPAERLRVYGHPEHVRSYGPDFADRVREAGLEASVFYPRDLVPRSEQVRMGLATSAAGEIFFCRKA